MPTTQYHHHRTGEDNADAHLKRQVMGREVVVAITKGKLDFGPWFPQSASDSAFPMDSISERLAGVSEVTRILRRTEAGDRMAPDELLPLVYDELRQLASRKMTQEAPGHTLQTTALVHEAWLRLVREEDRTFAGRTHFFFAAAQAMRRILVEEARRRGSQKRGGDVAFEAFDESSLEWNVPSDEVLAVHEALDQLAAEEPLAAQVVQLRYFAGLTISEVAESLAIAPRTADRHWQFARAWLKRAIQGGARPSDG